MSPVSPRAEVLDRAKELVLGDRNNQYGPPTQDFRRTAGVLNALGYRKGEDGQELEPHDVATIIASVKLSRLMWSPEKKDHWDDLAGYAACGYECVVDESKSPTEKYLDALYPDGKLSRVFDGWSEPDVSVGTELMDRFGDVCRKTGDGRWAWVRIGRVGVSDPDACGWSEIAPPADPGGPFTEVFV